MHRNSYIDSPRLLRADFSMRDREELYFAGQMTGVEGYIESAASGLVAGLSLARRLRGLAAAELPRECALGALGTDISDPLIEKFQPMNINFGLLPPTGAAGQGQAQQKRGDFQARAGGAGHVDRGRRLALALVADRW